MCELGEAWAPPDIALGIDRTTPQKWGRNAVASPPIRGLGATITSCHGSAP